MDRRKALTIAGTAAMVVAASGLAMAANFGVLGVAGAGDGSVGTLDADDVGATGSTTTAAPQVIVIDQYDVVPAEGGQVVLDQPETSSTGEETPGSRPPAGAESPALPESSPAPTARSSSDDAYHDDYDGEDEDHEDEHRDEHESEFEEEHEDD